MAILERTPPRRREDASQQASTSAIPILAQSQQHDFPSLDAMAMPFREGSASAMSPSISRSPGKKQPVISTTLSPADKIVRRLSTVAAHPKQPLASARPADVESSPTVGRRAPSPRKGEVKSPVAKRALQQSWKRKAPSASPERAIRPARPADANPSSVDDAFQRQLEAALLADNPFLKERTRKMDEKERAPATVPSPMPVVTAAAVQGRLQEQLPRQLVTASALLQDERPLQASEAAGTSLHLPKPLMSFPEEVIIEPKLTSTIPDRSGEINRAGIESPDLDQVHQEEELEPVAHQEEIATSQTSSSAPAPTSEVLQQPLPILADADRVERREEEQIAPPNLPVAGREQMRPNDEVSYPSATNQTMVQPRKESPMMYSQSHVDNLEKHIEKLEKRHRQLAKEGQKLRNSLTEAKADAESMFTRWTADKETADRARQDAGRHQARIFSADAARDLAIFEESQRLWEQMNGSEGLEAARQTRIKLIEARNEANYQKSRANEQSMARQELELRLDDLRVREERALEGQARNYEASMRQLTREHEAAVRQRAREHEAAARELRSAKGTSAFEEKERRNLASRLERIETERANLAVESQGYARLLEEERERCARLREEMATMRGQATMEQELRRELALLRSELKQAKRQTQPAPSSSVVADRSPISKSNSSVVAAGKRKAAPSTRIMQSVRSHIVDDSEEEQGQASLDEEVSDIDERRPNRAAARSQVSRPATRANTVTRAPVAKAKVAPVTRKRLAEPSVDRNFRQEDDDEFEGAAATRRHPHPFESQKEGKRRGKMPSTREIELVDGESSSEAETGDDDNDEDDDDHYVADEYTVKKASKPHNAKKRQLGKSKVPTVEAALAATVASAKSSSASASASANEKMQAKEDEKRRKAMQEHVEATPIISAAAKRPRPIPAAKRSSPDEEDGEEAAQSPLSAKKKEASALLTDTDNKENEVKEQTAEVSTKEQQESSAVAAAPPLSAAVASQQQQPKKRKLLLNRNKQPASANFLDMRGNADGNLEPVFNLPLAMSPIKGAPQQQLQPQGTTKMGGRAGTSGFGAGANSVFRR